VRGPETAKKKGIIKVRSPIFKRAAEGKGAGGGVRKYSIPRTDILNRRTERRRSQGGDTIRTTQASESPAMAITCRGGKLNCYKDLEEAYRVFRKRKRLWEV